jgi:hypothetical protein
MKSRKTRNLIFIFTVLVAHTFVLSFWLKKEVKKTSLNATKIDSSTFIKSQISTSLQFNVDSDRFAKPSITLFK